MTDMQSASKQEFVGDAAETRETTLCGNRGQRWFEAASTALTSHWPEYLMEAACLGLFMISACSFVIVLEHPSSIARHVIESSFVRRMLIGIAMGLTAIALIYSPWGKQSGAHFNPSVTLAFFRLGKVSTWDAFFYIVAQCAGAVIGVLLCAILLAPWISDPQVNYAVTASGPYGVRAALLS